MQKRKREVLKRGRQKVFVIGLNKTATTSVHSALLEFDIMVGNQGIAEKLLDSIVNRKYKELIFYCNTGEAFQDVPFSIPNVYKVLDEFFPSSKFILTIRDNKEQWYNSISKFHANLWGDNGDVPTRENLANSNFIYKGYPLKLINYIFGNTNYDKQVFCDVYEAHKQDVIAYFKNRPSDLLVVNVSKKIVIKNFVNL